MLRVVRPAIPYHTGAEAVQTGDIFALSQKPVFPMQTGALISPGSALLPFSIVLLFKSSDATMSTSQHARLTALQYGTEGTKLAAVRLAVGGTLLDSVGVLVH